MAQSSSTPPLRGMVISDTSIKQPVFITMLMLLTIVVGYLSYTRLPVNLFPEISPPVVFVSIAYPGAGPESVADQVAKPMEDELSTLNGVTRITSNSSEGFASVIIEFEQEMDAVQALQDVRERTNLILPRLPQDIQEPVFQRFDPAQSPILTLAITSQSQSNPEQLRSLIEDEIEPRIQRTPGVGSTSITGGLVRQINVQLDLTRLSAFRLLPAQVSRAIDDANANIGLGDVGVGALEVNLRAPSMLQQPDDILKIGIPGSTYTVGDVATVEDGYADVTTYSRLNGNDAISLDIRKQSGTNTVTVAEEALTEINAAFAEYPDLAYIIVRNEGEEVRRNVNGAIEEIFFAILFALLVVLFFFRDLRNTLVTIVGLPVIMIGTFALIQFFGLTINIITLLALSVCVGLVIDDAIVVRENIFRHMERGESPMVAASRGTAEVSLAVVAMTLTIIAVFLPVAFTTGVTGIIFGSFGITVASAMAISLFEAFTLAPMLSAYFFKQKQGGAGKEQHQAEQPAEHTDDELLEEANEKLGLSARLYERLLGWTLRHRLLTVIVGIGVVVVSIYAATGIKVAFFPQQDAEEFGVGFELPPGTPLDVTNQLAQRAEHILLADPDVEAVLTTVGASSGAFGGAASSEKAEFFVRLHEGASTQAVQARLRALMPPEQFPEIVFSLASFTGTGTDVTNRPLQARILTTGDLDAIAPLVPQMEAALDGIAGLTDIDSTYTPGKPEIQFLLKPERAKDLGLSNDDMARSLRALVDGDKATVFREQGKDYDVVVRLKPGDRQNFEELRMLRIPLGGQMVPLASITDIRLESSPTTIRRSDRQTEVIIGGNNIGRNINEVQADMQTRLDTVPRPADVRIAFGGNTEDQAEGFLTILIAMGLSVVFVYMVLASQFASFLQPFVIMLAMPLSFLGAFVALRMTGIELTIFGMIGMVLLLGLVTKNSILLVDFTNRLYRAGWEKNAAITRAGGVRLRPILMTSVAILMGNVPAAVGFGEGAELRQGLATIVIGGLITSTLLTLLFVPVAYSLLESATRRFDQLGRWRPGWRKGTAETDTPVAMPEAVGHRHTAATDALATPPEAVGHRHTAATDAPTAPPEPGEGTLSRWRRRTGIRGDGKWRMESGEWKMENGEWRMAREAGEWSRGISPCAILPSLGWCCWLCWLWP